MIITIWLRHSGVYLANVARRATALLIGLTAIKVALWHGLNGNLRVAQNRESDSGQALTELTALFPFLLLILIGVVDISRALNQYLQLSRIAYEGSRFAASAAGLENGSFGVNSLTPWQHSQVQDRVFQLLRNQVLDDGSEITTEFSSADLELAAGIGTHSVTVSIQRPYDSLFTTFAGLNIRVAAKAPYLYPESR